MHWNKYQENILKKWSSTSKTYSIMHSISAQYYSKWDKRLGIPVIIIGAIASSSIFTTSEINNIWTYVNGCLVLLMTGISGISKFLGLNEKQVKHTSAAFKYTTISMDIDTLLSFPRSDRKDEPLQFINEIKTAILEIREHSPNLPTNIVSDYINKLDKTLINSQTKVNRNDYNEKKRYVWNNLTNQSKENDKRPLELEYVEPNQYERKRSNSIKALEREYEETKVTLNTGTDEPNIYVDFTDSTTEKITQISERLFCDTDSDSDNSKEFLN
jgi:hypothetical protein